MPHRALFERHNTPAGERWEAPAQQTSESSRAGARLVEREGRVGWQCYRILDALAILGPLARFELVESIRGLTVNAACGRIGELKDPDRSSPFMHRRPPKIAVVGKRESPSGIKVDVYGITEAGLAELRKGPPPKQRQHTEK